MVKCTINSLAKAIDYIFPITFGAFLHLSIICQVTMSVTRIFFAIIRENCTTGSKGTCHAVATT